MQLGYIKQIFAGFSVFFKKVDIVPFIVSSEFNDILGFKIKFSFNNTKYLKCVSKEKRCHLFSLTIVWLNFRISSLFDTHKASFVKDIPSIYSHTKKKLGKENKNRKIISIRHLFVVITSSSVSFIPTTKIYMKSIHSTYTYLYRFRIAFNTLQTDDEISRVWHSRRQRPLTRYLAYLLKLNT